MGYTIIKNRVHQDTMLMHGKILIVEEPLFLGPPDQECKPYQIIYNNPRKNQRDRPQTVPSLLMLQTTFIFLKLVFWTHGLYADVYRISFKTIKNQLQIQTLPYRARRPRFHCLRECQTYIILGNKTTYTGLYVNRMYKTALSYSAGILSSSSVYNSR